MALSRWGERTPVEDLVARAVEDWVSAAEVYEVARRSGAADPEAARRKGIEVVGEALGRGLVVAGWTEATGHWPWDCSPTEAADRIAVEWLALPQPRPRPGDLFWLDNTPAGHALGREVLARERAASQT